MPDKKERIHRGYFIARKDSLEGLPAAFMYLKSYKERFNLFYIQLSSYTDDQWRKLQEVVGQRVNRTEEAMGSLGRQPHHWRHACPALATACGDTARGTSLVGEVQWDKMTSWLLWTLGFHSCVWEGKSVPTLPAFPPAFSALERPSAADSFQVWGQSTCETKSHLLYHNRFQKCRTFKTSPPNVIVYLQYNQDSDLN